MTGSRGKSYARLIIAVAVCEFAGILGSVFTAPAIQTWYAGLRKPDLAPPNWVFGPVWASLYLLMGISFSVVWNSGLDRNGAKRSAVAFVIQLVLNVLWSYLFFGLRSPLFGFVDIVALWFAILLTTFLFLKISKKAALLLIPYLLWVSFASCLNYLLLVLNP
jgi:tryptophan-rich sensory protein